MKNRAILVLWICLSIVVLTNSTPGQSAENQTGKQVTCTGKIINAQNQPIVGVKLSLYEMVSDEATFTYDPKLLDEVHTKADGTFSFKETITDNQYRYTHIIAEKEGLALGFDNWSMRVGDKQIESKLGPAKELSGIVIDEQGAPIADAEVTIYQLALGEGRERRALSGAVARQQLTTKTDKAGKFAFTHIPAGATAEFVVKKAGRGTLSTYKRTNPPSQKYTYAEGQKDIELRLPLEAKIEGMVVEQGTGKPIGNVMISCTSENQFGYFRPKPLVAKADGTFSVGALSPNQYVLELIQPRDKLPEWVAKRLEVITTAGETKSGINIEVCKGGILEVKITDTVTKTPIDKASVSVVVRNQANSQYQGSILDKSGVARMRLLPGDYQIRPISKQGYLRKSVRDTITIEKGKTENLAYELEGMPRIAGIVRDDKGHALEGVAVRVLPRGDSDVTTDSEGKFDITYDPSNIIGSRTQVSCLVCQYEKANLAAAVQLEEVARVLDVKLEPGLTITGKVADPHGNGIEGAIPLVYLRGSSWSSSITRNQPKTDKQGKFEIKAIPPEQNYNLYARADDYGEIRTGLNMDDIVDNRLDVGTVTLPLANLSVSGVVVDEEDKPVAGARINCSGFGRGQPRRDTQTDTEGKFTLERICAGKIRITVNKSGATRLYGSIETEGGAADVRITLRQRSTSRRYVTPRRELRLKGPIISDTDFTRLQGLTSLERLFLSNTNITDERLVHLKNLRGLKNLYLNETHISDAGLKHLQGLTSLESLGLRHTPITDAGLVYLKDLTSLKTLNINSTQVTEKAAHTLRESLPNLTIFQSLGEPKEVRKWRTSKFPREEYEVRTVYAIPEEQLEIPEDLQACAAKLGTIDAALRRCLKDTGRWPDRLSDLVPTYLKEEDLFCPDDRKHTSAYTPDPALPCSYCWELSNGRIAGNWDREGKTTNREWKLRQTRLFGDVVPIVRCMHHGNDRVLSLAIGGQIYWSPLGWERQFKQSYRFGQERSVQPVEQK
jgi:protocatechuate 3,4-dioxygenase beta subunit